MGNSQVMPKVDFNKEDLKTAHMYSKYLEAKNFERYLLTKKLIRKKRIIFTSSVALVLGIYTYTILRIKQETFLDDFEEPEVIKKFPPLLSIKEILELYQIRALKRLSQNFLLDNKLTDKIVNATGGVKDCEVCEIGPGPGGITRSILLQEPRRVFVVEKDTRFEPALAGLKQTAGNKLDVFYADILNFDLSTAFDNSLKKDWNDSSPNIHLVGNLPFSIADVLIFQYLKDISLRRNAWSYGRVRLTLTFQEEVAQRMTSEVLSKTRSRISVMCQNWCDVSHKFSISGKSFLPKVDVNVGVVHFVPLIEPVIDLDFHFVEKVVRVVFNSRQKCISNTIKNLFPLKFRTELTKELLQLADVQPKFRSFQLDLQEWKRLCLAYKEICDRYPELYEYDYRGPRSTREVLLSASQSSN